MVQWHFDDLLDSPDGLQALSAQGIPLSLVDSSNLLASGCGGTDRPLHSAVAAPLRHNSSPYIVVSYIPGSAVELRLDFPLTLTVLPSLGSLSLSAGGQAISQTGTVVPADVTLYYESQDPTFTEDSFTYSATLDSSDVAAVRLRGFSAVTVFLAHRLSRHTLSGALVSSL